MVFKRSGRPTFYFQAKHRYGWQPLSTGTSDRGLARKVEAMWDALANDHRAWDVLELVFDKKLTIGALYDLWMETERSVEEIRRRLNDVDVEPLIAAFLEVHASKVKPDTLEHITHHLRWLLPAGVAFPRSKATTEFLTTKLYAYPGKPGTIRKVHSDWSVFFGYLADVRGLFDRNPMDRVSRPPASKPAVRFYELDVVETIVATQPTTERKALFALLYGSAMEVSVALSLTRADLTEKRKEVRAAGTKTHTRDRMARVADWAWPTVWAHAKTKLPAAKLFEGVPSRYTASDWHAATVADLKLSDALPLKNARHHWAATRLRANAPIEVVQKQLGHSSPLLTLSLYGRFMPSAADRDRVENQVTEYEKSRREEQA